MRQDDGTSEARSGSSGRIDDGLKARIQAPSSAHSVCVGAEQARGAAASLVQEVTCLYSGHIHSGLMQVIGSGDRQIVSVQYKQSELDASPGTPLTVAVAEELVERLVLREAIAFKVQAGEPRRRETDLARAI
ncbi:hypothetical protein [Lichenihabitans psoromatis]|uniref:hypothetical protein n=1 Tax=Lichenihabitans psoromatis TaxID=2528642 RepID=UPI0010384292|nr:hypothetical protein [Lichenihabitans psoromatis]